MDKPFLVIREEFKEQMLKTIGESNLHMVVVEPILEEILRTVRNSIQQEYLLEKTRYETTKASEKEGESNGE